MSGTATVKMRLKTGLLYPSRRARDPGNTPLEKQPITLETRWLWSISEPIESTTNGHVG